MPLQDKEITEDQNEQSEEIARIRELEFEKDDRKDGNDSELFAANCYSINGKTDRKKNETKTQQDYKETIFNRVSKIQQNRSSFQKAVEATRKEAQNKVGALVK